MQVRFTLTLIGKLRGAIQGQATGFIFSMTCSLSLLLFWFNRPRWGLIVCSEWYRAVNVHFQTLTPRLRCQHSTPKHRMLLWTICNKLPGVEGKHTHTKKTCFYLWRDSSFRKLLPSKPISLSVEKVWCMGIKLTACLLIIEPFANCYGLNRGGIGHEERGAFSHLEVRSLLAGCHLSYNGKTRSNHGFIQTTKQKNPSDDGSMH